MIISWLSSDYFRRTHVNNNFTSYKGITKKRTLKFITTINQGTYLYTISKSRQNEEINRNVIMIFNTLNRWKSGNYYYLCTRKRRRTLKYRGAQKGAYRYRQRYKRLIPNGLPLGYATPGGSQEVKQLDESLTAFSLYKPVVFTNAML